MARYNAPSATARKSGAKTVNRAGGEAYAASPELALASLMLTSFVKQQYYRSEKEQVDNLTELLNQVEPTFAARAAIFARREFGMRSITHITAAEIAAYANKPWGESVKGASWVKAFIRAVAQRPDDMTEVVAYYLGKYGKPLPHGLREGLAAAFDQWDGYQLAKYRAERRGVKLVDIVNLVHPKPSKRNAEALTALVNEELKSTETWEAQLSKAGEQTTEEGSSKEERKAAAWDEMVNSGKMGYLALLRNLRNIATQASPSTLDKALKDLMDWDKVRKSRVFPFQYLTAVDAVAELPERQRGAIVRAIDAAIEAAVANVPRFEGTTLIAQDVSGSMQNLVNKNSAESWLPGRNPKGVSLARLGAVFSAALYRASPDADLMVFSGDAQYLGAHKDATVRKLSDAITSLGGGATDFNSIFTRAKRRYDRIIILSDMQGWAGYHVPKRGYLTYCNRYEANPQVISVDLAGYGDLQFPERGVLAMAGLSEKIFDIMKALEQDPQALVNRIRSVSLPGAPIAFEPEPAVLPAETYLG